MPGGLLDKRSILERLHRTPPLIEGVVDLDTQLQPNGVDLTLRSVERCPSGGAFDFSNASRRPAEREPAPFDSDGAAQLAPGSYVVTFNEIVHMPSDLAALGRTRSSLLRSGVALHTGVWDAGYTGRSESLLVVYNPHGCVLQRDARILQLVFFRLEGDVTEGYRGIFHGENL